MNETISVICVYNNIEQLNNELLKSLGSQSAEYELILIDNRKAKFSSAAKALNYGVKKSHGDILIFSHQDIYLKRNEELSEFAEAINKVDVGDIVGTQGTKEPDKKHYANLTSGQALDVSPKMQENMELIEVSCVDEGLFGMKRETWDNHNFDVRLCDNWHLYCVEQCLNARKHGNKVYVWPSQVHHFSKGSISLGYMHNLRNLCQAYRKDFKYIWTTCYKVRTNRIYINCLVYLWKMNRIVRRKRME